MGKTQYRNRTYYIKQPYATGEKDKSIIEICIGRVDKVSN
jgi:hypothetical protein